MSTFVHALMNPQPAPDLIVAPSPGGRRLAVLEHGELRLIDLGAVAAGKDNPELAIPTDAHALALFDDAIWLVEGDGDATLLRRLTLALDEVGTVALPPGRGFVRAAFGRNAALWLGATPIVVADVDGTIVLTPVHGVSTAAGAIAALSANQLVVEHAQAIALHEPGRVRWRHALDRDHRVLAMAAIFDGRSIVALIGRAGAADADDGRHLLVLSSRDGRVDHRLAVRGIESACFATRRGLAVLRAGRRAVVFVDLRFGRVIGQAQIEDDVTAVTIDDAGEHLVVNVAEHGLRAYLVRDVLAGSTLPREAGDDAPVEVEAPPTRRSLTCVVEDDEASLETPSPPATLDVGPLRRLTPRSPLPPPEMATSVRDHLALQREVAMTRAGLAITRAWDRQSLSRDAPGDLPAERRVDAILLGLGGGAGARVAEALDDLRLATDALADATPGPLDALVDAHGLGAVERDVLFTIAAADLWPDAGVLYGILGDDAERAACDERLVCELLASLDPHEVLDALDRGGALITRGLVGRGAGPRATAPLTVDPLVIRCLRGAGLDRELERGVERVEATTSLEELQVPRDDLARLLVALAGSGAPARVALRGRQGSGRRTVAAALAARAGRALGVIDVGLLVREQRVGDLAILLRRASLRGWLALITGVAAIGENVAALRGQLLDLLEAHPGPVLVRLPRDVEPPLAPGHLVLDLPPMSTRERGAHWARCAGAAGLALGDVDRLAARYAIGPGTIARVIGEVALGPIGVEPADAAVDEAVRTHLASRLGSVATRVERLPPWSHVVLPVDIQDAVIELMGRIRHRRAVFDDWGLDKVMSTSRGLTALFQGGPGTGKTLVAGAIARDLGLELYRVDLSRVVSKWIGETEQNLARVFDAAEEAQAILLFDEADSLFTRRTEVRTSTDRYANQEVNYLLQRLDTFEGIAILTTNAGSAIDPAFRRRMSFRLTFPFPDDEARAALWRVHLPPSVPRAGELDLADLARRFRMSGGFIRNAVLRACFLAADEGAGITQGHLERAIRSEFREIGKLGDGGVLE